MFRHRTMAVQRPGSPHVLTVRREIVRPAALADPPRVVLQFDAAAVKLPGTHAVHAAGPRASTPLGVSGPDRRAAAAGIAAAPSFCR